MKKKITKRKVKPRPTQATIEKDETLSQSFGLAGQPFGSLKEKIQKGSHVVGQAMQVMGRRLKSY